jgi:hypothetical protein
MQHFIKLAGRGERDIIQVNIIFKTNLFEPIWQAKLAAYLNKQFASFAETINLTTLESFIITGSFYEEILHYQEMHGLQGIGTANISMAAAIGKAMKHVAPNGTVKQSVIISDHIIAGLAKKELAQTSLHSIHRELCHVHDSYYMHKIFTSEGNRGDHSDRLAQIVHGHSLGIWPEYHVERLSYITVDFTSFEASCSHFVQLLETVYDSMQEEITKYRSNHNVNHLFQFTEEQTDLLFKAAAAIMGTLHAYKEFKPELYTTMSMMLTRQIETQYVSFLPVWNDLELALEHLYQAFPNWNDVTQLHELDQIILKLWNVFGIYPQMNENNQVYIHIPL